MPLRMHALWLPLQLNITDMHSSLQAAQLELERQRATDNLKKGLEHRPEREELERRM